MSNLILSEKRKGDGIGYEPEKVSGHFSHKKKKKKVAKEQFSNWREELSEIADVIDTKEKEEKIVEKEVNNNIKINPSIAVEAVENLGGTLLEMVEINELDYIIESTYDEFLQEGYDPEDIEDAIQYALQEAEVTYGHDTHNPNIKPKKEGLVKRFKEYVRSKLLSGANKINYYSRQAINKLDPPSKTHSKSGVRAARPYSGTTRKYEVAGTPSNSSGSTSSNVHSRSGVRSPRPYRGTTRRYEVAGSPSQDIKTVTVSDDTPEPRQPKQTSSTTSKPSRQSRQPKQTSSTISKPKTNISSKRTTPNSSKTITQKLTPGKVYKNSHTRGLNLEDYNLLEKTLTKAESIKQEEIVKSMKKKLPDFIKRYGSKERAMEVIYATAAKMAKKLAEETTNTASYEMEGDTITERRRIDKGTPRPPEPSDAFKLISKSMGSTRAGTQPRGVKKVPGKKPPRAGEYGGPLSPAQKVERRRATVRNAQSMFSSRFD